MTYYQRLREIQAQYPELTFQNVGYEYLSKEVKEEHAEQIAEISEILKATIGGFQRFDNFKIKKNGLVVIRCQFDWSYKDGQRPFYGVGYFPITDWLDYEKKDGNAR